MTESASLEEQVGIKGHNLTFAGVGGIIKLLPEDFLVHEILPNGEILYTGDEIGKDVGGMYVHFVLWKRGLDTNSALKRISKLCHHNEKDFGYAGLKDAHAETIQRISVWSGQKECLGDINLPNLKILNPIRQKFGISIGDLVGNRFQVRIRNTQRNVNHSEWKTVCSESESNGFLNFYGLQRFGSKRPILHKFGRYLLQEKYSLAIDSYLGTESKFENEKISSLRKMYVKKESLAEIYALFPYTYSFERRMLSGLMKRSSPEKIIRSFPIYFLRLAISAYQSFIFNKLLSKLHTKRYELLSQLRLPIIGYSTNMSTLPLEIKSLLQDFLAFDNLNLKSFNHEIKKLSSKGTERAAIVKPSDVKITSNLAKNDDVQIHFSLPKGSYGTMFLREVI
ncbi:tRNA pseudouridine(13) synthase TruD [Candidatus Heimdallarchaeota archaeon B3_Heim]|nr:MAG: tRNA pseudouridine(13) synthase TruD [Candidatus Heimdallarchaeota archaeon B3_Heim]